MPGLIEGRIRRSNKVWRNPIELARAIDLYIQDVWDSRDVVKEKSGKQTTVFHRQPSLAGLCLHLGLPSKTAYRDLCLDRNRYIAQVAVAGLTWLESHYVEAMQAYGANVAAFQFLLSNMGYKSDNVFKVENVRNAQLGSSQIASAEGQQSIEAPSVRNIQISFVKSPDSLPDDIVRDQLLSESENPNQPVQISRGVTVE